ncbi:MAG: glucokinase [Rhizobiaceae bacterium]|nr:glucokinase [Rhizobiaceae bacterium]
MSGDMDFPVLVGDIGGTNSRFGLINDAHSELEIFTPVNTNDFPDLQSLINKAVYAKTSIIPKRLVIGIAAPVIGSEYKLTYSNCKVIPDEIVADLNLKSAEFMNDFPAQALGVLAIGRSDMQKIGGGKFKENATRVVLGPGTSFGVATLIHANGRWAIIPGEGACADFGLGTGLNRQRELQIQPFLNRKNDRQTVVDLISGPGLENLYQAICRADDIKTKTSDMSAANISVAALNTDNAAALEAVEIFAALLGRVAANHALGVMALGGVYVSGGMAHKMLTQIKAAGFRREFEHKPPLVDLAKMIPTYFVNKELAALEGLANYVRTPDRYDMSHASAIYHAK